MLRGFFRQDTPVGGGRAGVDDDPLRQLMQLERFGVIVTRGEKWRAHPDYERTFQAALDSIDQRFSLVPEGFVSMPQTVTDEPGCPEIDYETEPFLLARTCVTNAQYQKFVDSGGYSGRDKVPSLRNWLDRNHPEQYWARDWAPVPSKAEQQVADVIDAGQAWLRSSGASA